MPQASQSEDEDRQRRPAGMPTPPGAELADSDPLTDSDSKTVMLRAERNDEIEIAEFVRGGSNHPETFTVVKRTDTYFGPQLLLHAENDDGEDLNYLLTCPGPNTFLVLWSAITGQDDRWRDGWNPVAEVRARLGDVEQYNICDHCGEPLRTMWHERLSAIRACNGDDTDD